MLKHTTKIIQITDEFNNNSLKKHRLIFSTYSQCYELLIWLLLNIINVNFAIIISKNILD